VLPANASGLLYALTVVLRKCHILSVCVGQLQSCCISHTSIAWEVQRFLSPLVDFARQRVPITEPYLMWSSIHSRQIRQPIDKALIQSLMYASVYWLQANNEGDEAVQGVFPEIFAIQSTANSPSHSTSSSPEGVFSVILKAMALNWLTERLVLGIERPNALVWLGALMETRPPIRAVGVTHLMVVAILIRLHL